MYEQWQIAMKYAGMFYDVLFQRLFEVVEQVGEDTSKGIHTVICDPQYSTRPILELSDSEHDRLSLPDMSHYV